jgi:hypothetical protein
MKDHNLPKTLELAGHFYATRWKPNANMDGFETQEIPTSHRFKSEEEADDFAMDQRFDSDSDLLIKAVMSADGIVYFTAKL